MINFRVDPRLKKAMMQLAEQRHISVSDLIRQAVIAELEKVGINWLEIEVTEENKLTEVD